MGVLCGQRSLTHYSHFTLPYSYALQVTTAVSAITQSGGALQPDGTSMVEPQFFAVYAANTVHAMAALPLEANALDMTVLATNMPFVGRG